MQPIQPNDYVPVLIAKQGERKAVSSLPPSIKNSTTPLFVAPPLDVDFETGSAKKSIDDHVSKFPVQLAESWGSSAAFLDAGYLPDDPLVHGEHALEYIVRSARQEGLPLTPVTAPSRAADHISAVRRTIDELDEREVGIRLTADEWPAVAGYTGLNNLMATLNVQPEQVHLLFDLSEETGHVATALAIAEIRGLKDSFGWKSIALLSTGIPVSMPSGRGIHELDRSDWRLYSSVRSALAQTSSRTPSFGDYAVAGASLAPEVDPRLLSISGTIRYTIDDRWIISKGALYKGPGGTSVGGKAVVEAAEALRADGRFLASSHCETEKWVENVADEVRNGGNPTVWREVGTRHHLTFVTQQIATTFGP